MRSPSGPRLASLLGGAGEADAETAGSEWAADEELKIISLSADLAETLGVDVNEAAGTALTRLLRLEEDENGEMPLISALAARRGFSGQRARGRNDEGRAVILSGEVVTGADGGFAGFRGTVRAERTDAPDSSSLAAFDHALDEVLRSPLDRIIESAERIVERADGPLRSEYASYGNDIATAARHLLSVVRAMSEDPTQGQRAVDLTALAAEAVVMVEPVAEERDVAIELGRHGPLAASGQERGVIQILVNLIGNAVRHSPDGGTGASGFRRNSPERPR